MSGKKCGNGNRFRMLFLPMRGYELGLSPLDFEFCMLFLPMRGYERFAWLNEENAVLLFLPMRGYEGIKSRLLCCKRNVISPHEGL